MGPKPLDLGFPELICLGTAGSGHKTLGEPSSNPAWLLIRRAVLQSDNLSKLSFLVCEIRITEAALLSRGFLGGLNRMLNIKFSLLCRHISRPNKSKLPLPSPFSHQDRNRILSGTNPVGCITNSFEQSLCYEWGVYFLPSTTLRLGIIQPLCESPSHLSLTGCPGLLDRGCGRRPHEKGCGPLCRCLLSDKLVSRGFSAPGSSVRCTGVPGLCLHS